MYAMKDLRGFRRGKHLISNMPLLKWMIVALHADSVVSGNAIWVVASWAQLELYEGN